MSFFTNTPHSQYLPDTKMTDISEFQDHLQQLAKHDAPPRRPAPSTSGSIGGQGTTEDVTEPGILLTLLTELPEASTPSDALGMVERRNEPDTRQSVDTRKAVTKNTKDSIIELEQGLKELAETSPSEASRRTDTIVWKAMESARTIAESAKDPQSNFEALLLHYQYAAAGVREAAEEVQKTAFLESDLLAASKRADDKHGVNSLSHFRDLRPDLSNFPFQTLVEAVKRTDNKRMKSALQYPRALRQLSALTDVLDDVQSAIISYRCQTQVRSVPSMTQQESDAQWPSVSSSSSIQYHSKSLVSRGEFLSNGKPQCHRTQISRAVIPYNMTGHKPRARVSRLYDLIEAMIDDFRSLKDAIGAMTSAPEGSDPGKTARSRAETEPVPINTYGSDKLEYSPDTLEDDMEDPMQEDSSSIECDPDNFDYGPPQTFEDAIKTVQDDIIKKMTSAWDDPSTRQLVCDWWGNVEPSISELRTNDPRVTKLQDQSDAVKDRVTSLFEIISLMPESKTRLELLEESDFLGIRIPDPDFYLSAKKALTMSQEELYGMTQLRDLFSTIGAVNEDEKEQGVGPWAQSEKL